MAHRMLFEGMDKCRICLWWSLSELGNSWMKIDNKREFGVIISGAFGQHLFAAFFRRLFHLSLSSEAT